MEQSQVQNMQFLKEIILKKYSIFLFKLNNSGYAYFTVWTPEIPLEINIPDDKLSQINNWKIPDSIEK